MTTETASIFENASIAIDGSGITVKNGTTFAQTNLSHWDSVRRARLHQGLPNLSSKATKDSPLVGKKLIPLDGEARTWTIEQVAESWYAGYYTAVIAVDNKGSHATFIIKNESCLHPDIIRGFELFIQTFGPNALVA